MELLPEKNEIKLLAKSVYAADFFDQSLYYVDEDKRCLYKVSLDTGNREVIRTDVDIKKKGIIYSDILSVGGKLYYVRRDKRQIFCYSEDGEDVVIGGKRKEKERKKKVR